MMLCGAEISRMRHVAGMSEQLTETRIKKIHYRGNKIRISKCKKVQRVRTVP